MCCIVSVENMGKYILTTKATYWACKEFGEYSFIDVDQIRIGGYSKEGHKKRLQTGELKYSITFSRTPKNRKKDIGVVLGFNDYGILIGVRVNSTSPTAKEVKMWADEAIAWLATNGYIAPTDGNGERKIINWCWV